MCIRLLQTVMLAIDVCMRGIQRVRRLTQIIIRYVNHILSLFGFHCIRATFAVQIMVVGTAFEREHT